MPRIPPTLLRHARCLDRLLPSLLPVCRDLSSAQNELRWLGEHAAELASKQGLGKENRLIQGFVNRRARGEPLQYILGTEFFGELEIKCKPGVLIPRLVELDAVFHACLF
jgi:methylase of polypeptide subunit release factors